MVANHEQEASKRAFRLTFQRAQSHPTEEYLGWMQSWHLRSAYSTKNYTNMQFSTRVLCISGIKEAHFSKTDYVKKYLLCTYCVWNTPIAMRTL